MTGTAGLPAGGYLDQESLLERILGHIAHSTTDLASRTWREPVEHYRSPVRLAEEVELVLRRRPVPFCPSAALPDPRSYLARDSAGVPVVAVRGRDGAARAFRNACRHRGAVLVSGSGCATSLVCPYHGWTYRLDGTLRHVPDEHGFPELDKDMRGLVELDVTEHGGLVWVNQDGAGTGPEGVRQLPELLRPGETLVDSADFLVDANWKVLAEGFLEGYHLRATHHDTFLPFGYDNLTVVEHSGPHSRVTFPFRRVETLRDQKPGQRSLEGAVTTVDHVFPNVIVARLSHHTTMVVLEPVTVDRTREFVYQLTSTAHGTSRGSDARRDRDFVAAGAAEDLEVAVAVQHGLASGANEFLEFGRFEGAITHFHDQLDQALRTAGTGPRTSGLRTAGTSRWSSRIPRSAAPRTTP
jgi:phenylpropionate dioxygenase-like ring-hydroxylating dioxygenase large terminal subunit